MADAIFSKRALTPRELDMRTIPNDYRPRKLRMRASGDMDDEHYETEELHEQNHSEDSIAESGQVNSRKPEHELSRDPVGEIAAMVRALTYGEMMELAQAIWKIRPEGADVDQNNLPMLLHRWSTSSEH